MFQIFTSLTIVACRKNSVFSVVYLIGRSPLRQLVQDEAQQQEEFAGRAACPGLFALLGQGWMFDDVEECTAISKEVD
jgi:hypothetical protein